MFIQELDRYRKLSSLRNVVLLSSRAEDNWRSSLEKKINARIKKEFPNPTSEESEVIEGMLDSNLRFAKRTIKQQNDGEFFIQIRENVREKDVHLFHKFSDPNLSMMELLVMGDALKRAGVSSVTLYLPYIPYERQDKKDDGRVPISARLVFDLLEASLEDKLKRIVTFDLHAKQEQGYFNGPLDELSAIPDFAAYYHDLFKEEFSAPKPNVLVVSPDPGGAKRARLLAELLRVQYEVLDKVRTGHGQAEHRFYLPVDVKDKKVILVDDIIDSGSTLVGEYENSKPGPVQYLQMRGAELYICVTHAVLSKKNGILAEERMQKAGVPTLFAHTLPEREEGYYNKNKNWMSIISLDYVLAKAFYCNQAGESISEFLKKRDERLLSQFDFVVTQQSNGILGIDHTDR